MDINTTLVHTIDVIIPIQNEGAYIDTLIEQVVTQEYLPSSIIIVVAPSDDDTLEKAHHHAGRHPEILVLENPDRTAAHAMNLALDHVTADAWVRIDGHTEVPSDLLRVLRNDLNLHAVACVGPVLRPGARTPRQHAIGLAMSSPFGVGNARFRTGLGGSGPTDTVAFGLYRRAFTDIVGRYETELVRNQDDQFNTRLRMAGGSIWLTDNTYVTYFPRPTFTKLFSQYLQYGHWRMIGTLRHGNSLRPRQLAPVGLVLALPVSAAALTHSPRSPVGWLAPLAYSLVLTSQLAREKLRAADTITAAHSSVAIATMHISYGLGTIMGLITGLRSAWLKRGKVSI